MYVSLGGAVRTCTKSKFQCTELVRVFCIALTWNCLVASVVHNWSDQESIVVHRHVSVQTQAHTHRYTNFPDKCN